MGRRGRENVVAEKDRKDRRDGREELNSRGAGWGRKE